MIGNIINMKKILFLAALSALVACESGTKVATSNETTTVDSVAEVSEKPSYPEDRKFNDLAKFIAGEEGDAQSSLKELEASTVWKNYKGRLDEIWKKTNDKLPVMKEWSRSELAEPNKDGGTLFYPFSGPDFLHADVFFPEYENIVMVGLEPIGSYPDMLAKAKNGKDEVYLNGVVKSMHAILGLSFFRTIAMADDFNGEVDGTLPILMQFMNRTGNDVLYQEKVAIQPNGELTSDLTKATDSTYFGNRYYFKREGSDKVRTLTYFAVNLQNDPYVSRGGLVAKGLLVRTDFVNYLKGLNIESTYLKSASYLMHRPTFSIVRDIILNESEFVLQDDSGIPVKFFPTTEWERKFYGTFTKPISLFAERGQPDLKEIYAGEGVKPLPFGIGYQYKNGTSNLMLAKKKK